MRCEVVGEKWSGLLYFGARRPYYLGMNSAGDKTMGTTCEHCVKPEGAINHVPGHVFVGWGHGWQPCVYCGGSMKGPDAEGEHIEFQYHWFDPMRGRVADPMTGTLRRVDKSAQGTPYAMVDADIGGGYDVYWSNGEWHHGG